MTVAATAVGAPVTRVTATSAHHVQSAVREAAAARAGLRVIGRGHWLDAGRPVSAARELALRGLSGIVEYTAGDWTLTALAGTSLAEIARATAAEGQWLSLDPFGTPEGSLGATVATGSAGPIAHAFGSPRDVVLGLELVTGTGTIVRGGGRVVKNVAGFDLTRLFTGSWGTLGAITEVTVRLRALPEVDDTYAIPVGERAGALDALATRLRLGPIAPMALELVNARLAELLGIGRGEHVLVRCGGNADSVRAQRAWVAQMAPLSVIPTGVWNTLRTCEPPRSATVRLSDLPSRIAALWGTARAATLALPNALAHASLGRGIVRSIVPYDDEDEIAPWLAGVASAPGARIFERLPASSWRMAASGAAGDRLSRRIKQTFDPHGVLNPGILGETI